MSSILQSDITGREFTQCTWRTSYRSLTVFILRDGIWAWILYCIPSGEVVRWNQWLDHHNHLMTRRLLRLRARHWSELSRSKNWQSYILYCTDGIFNTPYYALNVFFLVLLIIILSLFKNACNYFQNMTEELNFTCRVFYFFCLMQHIARR